MIPDDFEKEDFLKKFRRVVSTTSNVLVQKAACVNEPHRRWKPSSQNREGHKHIAMVASGTFAHKKIADAFQREHGLRISFSFKQKRFVGNLVYLVEAGKKPSTDIDSFPAKFPPNLDLEKELEAQRHPGDAEPKAAKKRKRLTFDEVSNVVLEGVGEGPLKTGQDLESASKKLKLQGKTELWNYLGDLKTAADTSRLVSKVWRMFGGNAHPMFRTTSEFPLGAFKLASLPSVRSWLKDEFKTKSLVLSGSGGLGKTNLGEALLSKLCAEGFWFVDDPDDFREIDGLINSSHGLLVDEISLEKMHINQVKKMVDLEKTRRVKCRHFNGTLPKGCPRIFCTNSSIEDFFPDFPSKADRVGVLRRVVFVDIDLMDLRKIAPKPAAKPAPQVTKKPATFDDSEGEMMEED